MPVTPNHARSFLTALSDFWTIYFQDRDFLRGYAEGVELNAAQVYQRLLETALGVSLEDVPLFARDFHRPCVVRESDVRYEEGASPDEDLYVVALPDPLVAAAFVANRVVAPTAFLTAPREFVVRPGALCFRADPFGGLLDRFATRTARVVAPAAWRDPLGAAWADVRPGDALRVVVGSAACEAVVAGVAGDTLYLDAAPAELRVEVDRRGARAVALRTPYDDTVAGALLPDHPAACARLSRDADDGATVAGAACEVDASGVGTYQGAWAGSRPYDAGDLAWEAGRLWQARAAHEAGVSFDATLWDDLATGFFYLAVPSAPRLDGLYGALAPTATGRVRVAGPALPAGARAVLHRVRYGRLDGVARPRLALPHGHLREEGVEVTGRRAVARTVVDAAGVPTTHPAGQALVEGVDYVVDREAGAVTALSAWDPLRPARASYRWRLEVAARRYPWRGAYATATTYTAGDLVRQGSATWVVVRDHTSDGTVDAERYAPLREPVTFDVERSVREVSLWLTDALLDEEALHRNFGHLLARRRPSSEAQREFLRAVSRLFLRGPSFPLIESALNAVAGLPLVREDGEVLRGYDDGVSASASDGQLLDTMQGTDGVLDPGTGRFTAATAAFQPSDVGATLRVVVGGAVTTYAVAAVVSPTTVAVAPPPTQTATALAWEARHAVLVNRLRLAPGGLHRFRDEDVGAWVRLAGRHARNRGVFRIAAVDDPFTAELDTPYGFLDEQGVSWELSPEGAQVVRTDRREYRVPLGVPVRPALRDAANAGRLALAAFDAVSAAFQVVDYLVDPAWWHHVQIPEALFDAPAATRTVTPRLVEHVYGALDEPRHGDPGLAYGVDDDAAAPAARPCVATWYGGAEVVLAFAAGVAGLRARDAGSHLVVATPGFAGHYRVARVHDDGATVTLEGFPPPEARRAVPPRALDAELPPLLLRHAVAYVLMDRLLKYHCMQVRMDPSVAVSREVVGEMARLVGASRPSHVYVFVEAGTRFEDAVEVDEALALALGRTLHEPIRLVDTASRYVEGQPLRYGDAYRFVDRVQSVTPTPDVPIALPTALPAGTGVVRTLVKVGFDPAARVGSRQPAEGVDYDVVYEAGILRVRAGVTITPSPVTVHYVDCIRRTLAPGDPLDPGETPIVYGGADPTAVRGAGQDPRDAGFLDRAVQITFGV